MVFHCGNVCFLGDMGDLTVPTRRFPLLYGRSPFVMVLGAKGRVQLAKVYEEWRAETEWQISRNAHLLWCLGRTLGSALTDFT